MFGEGHGRAVVSLAPGGAEALLAAGEVGGVGVRRLGVAGGDVLDFGAGVATPVADLAHRYRTGLIGDGASGG
ncbi:MAG: hypothetical protein WKH64_15590 [Chloroflexia bacterium]